MLVATRRGVSIGLICNIGVLVVLRSHEIDPGDRRGCCFFSMMRPAPVVHSSLGAARYRVQFASPCLMWYLFTLFCASCVSICVCWVVGPEMRTHADRHSRGNVENDPHFLSDLENGFAFFFSCPTSPPHHPLSII